MFSRFSATPLGGIDLADRLVIKTGEGIKRWNVLTIYSPPLTICLCQSACRHISQYDQKSKIPSPIESCLIQEKKRSFTGRWLSFLAYLSDIPVLKGICIKDWKNLIGFRYSPGNKSLYNRESARFTHANYAERESRNCERFGSVSHFLRRFLRMHAKRNLYTKFEDNLTGFCSMAILP